MRRCCRRLIPLVLTALLALPLPAAALEILELSGGAITFDGNLGSLAVQGPRLAITSSFQAVLGSGEPGFKTCNGLPFPCTPGAILPSGGRGAAATSSGPVL
jgi:hypothetical protein